MHLIHPWLLIALLVLIVMLQETTASFFKFGKKKKTASSSSSMDNINHNSQHALGMSSSHSAPDPIPHLPMEEPNQLPSAQAMVSLIKNTCATGKLVSTPFFTVSITKNTIMYAKINKIWEKTSQDEERIKEWKHLDGLEGIATLPEENILDSQNAVEMLWECSHGEIIVHIYVKFK